MTTRGYTDAGLAAPGPTAPGNSRSYTTVKAFYDYFFLYYNNHIGGLADRHNSGSIDTSTDGPFPIITPRNTSQNTVYVEIDRLRRAWLELIKTGFVPSDFGTIAVPITLLDARNNIRSGLGSGNGLGVPGTDAPNVNPSTIPWRGASGEIAQVIGTVPLLAMRELLVLATATPSAAVIINPGSYIENGTGVLRAYGGGTIATLTAPGVGLERFDAVYLITNLSGAVVPAIQQGVAATVGSASAQVAIPDGGCLLATIYMNGTTNTVYNQNTVAGVFAPGGASYILEGRVLRGGGTPVDASLSMVKIKEFAPRPTTPPSTTVTVLGGGFFNSSNAPLKYAGSSFAYNGAANAALLSGTNPSLPASGFARFDGLSIDLATGLLTVTIGVPSNSGSETEPALPLTGRPVGYVHVTSTTTAIYANFTAMALATGGSTQGWIDDSYRVGAGGGTSGSTLATISPAHVLSGNDATYQDGFLGSSPVVTPSLTSIGTILPNGNIVQVIATQANPVKVSFNGVERRYPDPTIVNPPFLSTTAIGSGSANASGSAGYRYLVADISAGGVKTFAITIMTSPPVMVSTQAVIAVLWWDGSNLVTLPDIQPILNIDSALVNKRGTQIRWTGQLALNATGLTIPPGSPAGVNAMPTSAPFIVPPNARVRFTVRVKGFYHAGGTPAGASFFSWVLLDGATQLTGTQIDSANYSADGNLRETVIDEVNAGPSSLLTPGSGSTLTSNPLAPGQHTVTWGYVVAGTATFDASIVQIQVDVMHAGGN